MNATLRRVLMASAITAMMTSSVWAQSGMDDSPAGSPGTEPMEEAAPPMDRESGNGIGDNPLYSLTPNDLRRGEVLDASGEKVGTIKTVVADAADHERVHAVISSGGFMGIGAREIVVSFDELQLTDDKVQVSSTREEIRERQEYTPEEYVELEPDRPISEFSAFEPDAPQDTSPGSSSW